MHNTPALSPSANQFRGTVGFGDLNRRGWNAAFQAIYDYRVGSLLYSVTQVTYNTDCCGFSVQVRRFGFGNRNETVPVLAFSVANIGCFGTLEEAGAAVLICFYSLRLLLKWLPPRRLSSSRSR